MQKKNICWHHKIARERVFSFSKDMVLPSLISSIFVALMTSAISPFISLFRLRGSMIKTL